MKDLLYSAGIIILLAPIANALHFGALEGMIQGVGMILLWISLKLT